MVSRASMQNACADNRLRITYIFDNVLKHQNFSGTFERHLNIYRFETD